jgi:hypothetical protein
VPGPVRRLTLAVLAAAAVAAAGCSAGVAAPPGPATPAAPAPVTSTSAATTPAPTPAADAALRDELLAMLAADQADRAGTEPPDLRAEQARTDRLAQVVAERGWPTRTLVGSDGATAAWVIAQHSDLDPAFQTRALELMRAAAAAGEADPGELAYLVDRVAANAGRPQTYGTQAGCADDGTPQPAPIAEPERVDALRAEVGLAPLAEYLAELASVCAPP